MKVKLDENIPASVSDILADLGHDTDTVPEEGLQGRRDADVWSATQKAGAFLITQDLDFSDVRVFHPGMHHGIQVLRLREPGRRALVERIRSIFQSEEVDHWGACFVIATERKIRIRRPDR